MLFELLEKIKFYYDIMKNAGNSYDRADSGYKIIAIMREEPKVEEYWEYRPKEHFWIDRFVKIKEYNGVAIINDIPTFVDENTNLKNVPSDSGLYFISQVHFNPITNEKYYWVKIGLSKNIHSRFASYKTCCPMLYKIDFLLCNDYVKRESLYHRELEHFALSRNQNNAEWWQVDEDTYLTMCKKGFDYFNI